MKRPAGVRSEARSAIQPFAPILIGLALAGCADPAKDDLAAARPDTTAISEASIADRDLERSRRSQGGPVIIPGLHGFRARYVQIDPDTVWFTTYHCPEVAAAFVRRTGAWVRAMLRECRAPQPSPDSTRHGSMVGGQGGESLPRGMRIDRVEPGAGPNVEPTEPYYVLKVPDDTLGYPLVVSDSARAWAEQVWSGADGDSLFPFTTQVTAWLDDGASLYFGLDGYRYLECPVFGPCSEPPTGATGGLLRFDLPTRNLETILDPLLRHAGVRDMFASGNALWLFAVGGWDERSRWLYRFDRESRSLSEPFDSTPNMRGEDLFDTDGVGDTLWVATADYVAAFSVPDERWNRAFYDDSLGRLANGVDTVHTRLRAARPPTRDTVPGPCPRWGGDDVADVLRFLVCEMGIQRRTAFLAAAARLADSIPESIVTACRSEGDSRWVDAGATLWGCGGWNPPDGSVAEGLAMFLADSSMIPFLRVGVLRGEGNGYWTAQRALTVLDPDLARDALRVAFDHAPRSSVLRDLVSLGDSTPVWWLRAALRDTSRSDRPRLAELAEDVRDRETVLPLIELIPTAEPEALRRIVRTLVALTGADSAPRYSVFGQRPEETRRQAHAFWEAWWSRHRDDFEVVSVREGNLAVQRGGHHE